MIMTMIMVWKLNKIQLKTIIPRCQKSASLDTIMYVSFHINYSEIFCISYEIVFYRFWCKIYKVYNHYIIVIKSFHNILFQYNHHITIWRYFYYLKLFTHNIFWVKDEDSLLFKLESFCVSWFLFEFAIRCVTAPGTSPTTATVTPVTLLRLIVT